MFNAMTMVRLRIADIGKICKARNGMEVLIQDVNEREGIADVVGCDEDGMQFGYCVDLRGRVCDSWLMGLELDIWTLD